MRHGSLFSGIGGFDLASEWMDWTNVFHCEINPFCQKILKHYWPNADSLGNIKTTDFKKYEGQIDIISGGFPCQPYSLAGQRKGTEDDRHLWPEMLRAIREIKPKWVVGENVYGLVKWNGGLVFEEVHTDLEAEGYEVWAVILPAVSKDAPHRRDRVWFIAYSSSNGLYDKSTKANNAIRENNKQSRSQRERTIKGLGNTSLASNANGTRRKEQYTSKKSSEQDFDRFIMHTNRTSEQREYFGQPDEREFDRPNSRNEISYWQNFPSQSPICCGDDGLSTELDAITFPKWRNESIKGYGNAVVPQVVFEIFKVIQKIDYDRI